MSAFDKLLGTAPQALPGYWIGRHVIIRDSWMEKARETQLSEVRSRCVGFARERNRALVKALRGMRPDQPTGEA